jgi:hypothetical protein
MELKPKKSQIMLYVFFVMTLAAIFFQSLSYMWNSTLSAGSMNQMQTLAFYAAQSGLEQGKVFVWVNNTSTSGWICNNTTAWCNDTVSYSAVSGKNNNITMWYQFMVSPYNFTTPAKRYDHSAVYDPNARVIYVFGGVVNNTTYFNNTYSYNDNNYSWSQLSPTGVPSVRAGHTAVYDYNGTYPIMYVFGGNNNATYYNNTYSYNLTSGVWSTVSGTAPSVRSGHSAVYDLNTDKMYIFGGYSGSGYLNDTYRCNITNPTTGTWTTMSSLTGAASKRTGHTAVYDSNTTKMYVFGGWNGTAGGYFNDTYVFNATSGASGTWTTLTPTGAPSRRYGHSAVYDQNATKMYVFGGFDGTNALNDTYVYTAGANWTTVTLTGSVPARRYNHSAVYDPVTKEMFIFGGYYNATTSYNDTYSCNLNSNICTKVGDSFYTVYSKGVIISNQTYNPGKEC